MSRQRIRNPELKRLAQLAGKQGWTVGQNGAGHLEWLTPLGVKVITASTPGSQRSLREDKRSLERAGLVMNATDLRRRQREERAVPPREDENVAGSWKCRHYACAQSFGTPQQRDSHEELTCSLKPSPWPDPEPDPEPEPKLRPKIECPLCDPPREFRGDNMKKHFSVHHIEYVVTGVRRGVVHYERVVPDASGSFDEPEVRYEALTPLPMLISFGGPTIREEIVNVVFPAGMPMDPAKLEALADWLRATDDFLQKVGVDG